MHIPMKDAELSVARRSFLKAESMQSPEAQLMLTELGRAYADSELSPLSHVEWHELDFTQIIQAWHEALLEFAASKGATEHPGKAALRSFFQDRIASEHQHNPAVHRQQFLDTKYGSRSVRRLVHHLAKHSEVPLTIPEICEEALQIAFELWVEEAVEKMVPHGYYAELCFVPNWDGRSIDDMIDECALRSKHWRLRSLGELLPTEQMAKLLRFLNISKKEFIQALANVDSPGAKALRRDWAQFKASKARRLNSTIAASSLVRIINEAGTHTPVLMCHGQVDIGALLAWDPRTPMRWRLDRHHEPKVHIGMHDVINGGGYLDVFDGEVVIPAWATGFGWKGRWAYSINDVYGIYTPAVRVTPEFLGQANGAHRC